MHLPYEIFVNPPIPEGQAYFLDNIRKNLERPHKVFRPQPPHKKILAIVGGGPTLRTQKHALRVREKKADILACNGAHDWLLDHGIRPWACAMMDPHPVISTVIRGPVEGVKYLLASMVHPALVDKLAGADITFWHDHRDGVAEMVKDIVIPGGCSIGLKCLSLGYMLGYREMHLYGIDGCTTDGEEYAYPTEVEKRETRRIGWGDREFDCTPQQSAQAQDMINLLRNNFYPGAKIIGHGDGLIQYIANSVRANVYC